MNSLLQKTFLGKKRAKPLYEKDKLFLHRAKVRAINEYLDFKPVIERHIKKTLG
jgi:hypothetical protein